MTTCISPEVSTLEVYINGRPFRITGTEVGAGGEGVVYSYPGGKVVKIFTRPEDSPEAGVPEKFAAMKRRFDEYAVKLPKFPSDLPRQVIRPLELVRDASGQVIGYIMEHVTDAYMLQELSKPDGFASQAGSRQKVVELLIRLHELVEAVHGRGVVIGDFTDKNVLIKDGSPYLIDPDSLQFGGFKCRGFTARFVDSTHCSGKLEPTKDYTQLSDWYAFCVIAFQSLMQIHPYYGGVHQPTTGKRLRDGARTLRRMSVFHKEVIYPKKAHPLEALPIGLRMYFKAVFEHDLRIPFPVHFLYELQWRICPRCRLEHACEVCPTCQEIRTPPPRTYGGFTARRALTTAGAVLWFNSGPPMEYLTCDNGGFQRESGMRFATGELQLYDRFFAGGGKSIVARGSCAYIFDAQGRPVEDCESDPNGYTFTANTSGHFWIRHNTLFANMGVGPVILGKLPEGRKALFAGEDFGLGLSYTSAGVIAFTFDYKQALGQIRLGLPGPIDAVTASFSTFTDEKAWLTLGVLQGTEVTHYCFVIDRAANVVASLSAPAGSNNWLGFDVFGKCAVDDKLLSTSNRGVVRVGVQNGNLKVERQFPELSPLVKTGMSIVPSRVGLYLVGPQTIELVEPTSPRS